MGRLNTTSPVLFFLLSLLLPAFSSEWEEELPSSRPTIDSTSLQKHSARNERENNGAVAPLQGGVQLSDSLPPVPPSLRAGVQFDQRQLPPQSSAQDQWIWVPDWMAGVHRRDFATKVGRRFKILGAKLKFDRTFQDHVILNPNPVEQIDKLGRIWQYCKPSEIEVHDIGNLISYKVNVAGEEISRNDSQIVSRVHCLSIDVNKFSGVIERSYQQEQLDYLLPISSDRYRQYTYVKWFDASGIPTSMFGNKIDKIYCDQTLVRPFTPVDYYQGKDMRQSFKRFLMSHGMSDRVPDNLRD